ncbi:MAG: SPOR domain-containing protein [Pararhodobacter sp.]
MAHLHYDAYRAPGEVSQHVAEPLRMGLMVNVIGAVLSVALVAGVGVWSYRLMVRDVSGVPVVRALEGPMRISPDDPGGRQAAYQGLAVNAVAAEGAAGSAPQEIVLAPGPVALAGEDRPVQRAGAEPPLAAAPEVGRETEAEAMVIPASFSLGELDLVAPGTPGVARSPIPPRRPGGVRATMVAGGSGSGSGGHDPAAEALLEQLVTRLAPARFIDIDPDTLAAGTRLVQLGAYDDETAAREAWETLAGRFSAHLDGRGRIIEPASSGGRTFYRLRAHGFADEPEARRFCAVLLAENADCIPVLIR